MRSCLLAATLALLACLWMPVRVQAEAPGLPVDFFVERDRPVVAVVRVEGIQTSLRLSADLGERFYFSIITARVESLLRGADEVRADRPLVFVQPEFMAVRPFEQRPPLVGRTYLAWLDRASPSEQAELGAPLVAEGGFLLPLYGTGPGRYIEWHGRRATLEQARAMAASAPVTCLDQVRDPQVRIDVAMRQVRSGKVRDLDGLLRGMLLVLADPRGQAALVDSFKPPFPDGRDRGPRPATPFELWVNSLRTLQQAATDEATRPHVLAALRSLPATAPDRVRLEVAMVLAQLGDGSGRATLQAALQQDGFDLESPPEGDGGSGFGGRFRFASSRLAAAYYLGQVGDTTGLSSSSQELRLATLDGLGQREAPAIQATLDALKAEADREAAAATRAGRPVVGDAAHPSLWIRLHGILARRGNLDSLRLLARATLDAQAAKDADGWQILMIELDRALEGPKGAERLQVIQALPGSAELVARLRGSAPATRPPAAPRPGPTKEEIHRRVAEALASPKPQVRVVGMMAAAGSQLDEFHATVRKTALEATEDERLVAMLALGIYGKPLSAADRSPLLADASLRCRAAAIDLVSGFEPAADSEECAAAIRRLLTELAASTPKDEVLGNDQVNVAMLSMARLLSAGVPRGWIAGATDPNTRLRRLYVQAGAISGSPDVVPTMKTLLKDPDAEIRRFAEWAVRQLPWP